MTTQPALNVVVYRNPGPDDDMIETHARTVVGARSPWGTPSTGSGQAPLAGLGQAGGGLGYVTLVESDFDRLWGGVDCGDTFGTAYSVLPFLGPSAEQFIGRSDDFIFGWIGGADEDYGNVLLLQIIPKPHLLVGMN